jgi:hypothetical protein
MKRLCPAAAGLLVLAACDAPSSTPSSEPLAASTQSIIGGRPSADAQNAAVLVNEAGHPMCTGTMIASNLVLTARHCVTYYNEDDGCGFPLGRDLDAVVFTVSVGPYAGPSKTSARASRIYFKNGDRGVCGADIALLLLDRELPDVPVAKVRFTPPGKSETGVAVGYGEPGEGRRERPDVEVLAIGPASSTWTTIDGYRFPMEVPANDFVTGESTCFGDSGGPLFDRLGQVIGIASRGLPDDPDGCIDRPTYWTSVAPYEQMIREAATAAGHPLAAAQSPPHFGNTVSTPGGKSEAEADEDEEDGARRPKPTGSASVGCAIGRASPPDRGTTAAGFALAILGLALGRRPRRT